MHKHLCNVHTCMKMENAFIPLTNFLVYLFFSSFPSGKFSVESTAILSAQVRKNTVPKDLTHKRYSLPHRDTIWTFESHRYFPHIAMKTPNNLENETGFTYDTHVGFDVYIMIWPCNNDLSKLARVNIFINKYTEFHCKYNDKQK